MPKAAFAVCHCRFVLIPECADFCQLMGFSQKM